MPPTTALPAFEAPPLGLLAAEPMRALFDYFAGRVGHLQPVAGDGHPVVVYPGLGAGAHTTAQLRGYLRDCNLKAHDWSLGVNTGPEGDFDAWLEPLVERVAGLHAAEGRPVSLVGWSLGGVYAREIAKRAPQAVRQVITLATPFNSMGGGNHAGTIFKLLGGDTSRLTPELQQRLRQRPPVPTTSIYSRSDGLVSWRGCLEATAPDVENIAVQASHLGMTSHPEVLRIVADRLAQPEGRWRPYKARRRPRLSPATAPSRSGR